MTYVRKQPEVYKRCYIIIYVYTLRKTYAVLGDIRNTAVVRSILFEFSTKIFKTFATLKQQGII